MQIIATQAPENVVVRSRRLLAAAKCLMTGLSPSTPLAATAGFNADAGLSELRAARHLFSQVAELISARAALSATAPSSVVTVPAVHHHTAKRHTHSIAVRGAGSKSTSSPASSVTLARAGRLMKSVRDCARRGIHARVERIDAELARFRGLPVQLNLMDILRISNSESAYRDMLGWLLDPNGSHQLGDAFLRSFVAAFGLTARGRLFDHSRPLRCTVLREVPWLVPSGMVKRLSGGEERLGVGMRADLVILVEDDVFVLELKVDSEESLYEYDGISWQQAALYSRLWKIAHLIWTGQRRPPHDDNARQLASSIGNGLASASFGAVQAERFARSSRLHVGLIHHRDSCVNKSNYFGDREREHDQRIVHISWFDLEAALADVLKGQSLDPLVMGTLQSWRSTILTRDLDGGTISSARDLRFRAKHRQITEVHTFESLAHIDEAIRVLKHRDACCSENFRGKVVHDLSNRGQ